MENRKLKKSAKPAMTKKHPQWREFCNYLSGPEGIDLRAEGDDINKWKWNRDGEPLTKSEIILRKYFPEIDVPKTLKYFQRHGGYSDFEVLMNVDWGSVDSE